MVKIIRIHHKCESREKNPRRGGGGTLIFLYIRRLGSFFGGFKILIFKFLGVFRKINIFWGMNVLWIFLGSSHNWTIFSGHFHSF